MLTAVLVWALFSASAAAQQPTDKTTSEEVADKVAAETIRHYSVDQRDEAVKKAKEILDDLDARMDRMNSQLNDQWERMDQRARQEMKTSLAALRRQRNEVFEWYGGLKHSSVNAWEDVKQGFLHSYQNLRHGFAKARREY
jgi:predicted RNase H-like nuclease (RuvC/YqgF family)